MIWSINSKLKMKKLTLILSLAFFYSVHAFAADDSLWPNPVFPPPLPAGVNPAMVPVPVDGWFLRVQKNIQGAQGKPIDLVFDGDSITDWLFYKAPEIWKKYYAPRHGYDFGIAGDQIEHVLWRLKVGQVDGLHPKLVGTDDRNEQFQDQRHE